MAYADSSTYFVIGDNSILGKLGKTLNKFLEIVVDTTRKGVIPTQ